ncbi:TPA: sigma-70 family RNA polymerase sigma factor [Streptococcus equi subsp. zooepidemicus]|uniref:sigma-70 family RNA polymerase sigma factor n=1 Tax=Streptococcus equi TaxID=1336 RepID=UPI0005BB5202|nr:sigma-70 family RNA polymerase sigma factor [Streptococcus equi]KIS04390.1 DNA-binding protein [Streptococcus equi subsp. zooepidemicus Sz12is]MCD3460508.1 sigma-70 family RNA polymerase sigma factor [Streptococcus equi subsp. zooepidemicus]HEK9979459.1 sigma-70 family RNA polymerase sigma factor [Streptococcus equi subsp. zooepidemicus]HEK9991948.1 sigma-70 family RNA polymerase sigma factor [Streptococcus equi subsp. zooepidemicus]HEL0006340.1 sigma-70 family RNA polymerase sigma factor [
MKYFFKIGNQKLYVSEELYKSYWRLVNHEKYIERLIVKNKVCNFSDYNFDVEEIIPDEYYDIEKIMEKKCIIEELYLALNLLDEAEFRLISDIFFRNRSLTEISKEQNIAVSTVSRRRDKIVSKIGNILETRL